MRRLLLIAAAVLCMAAASDPSERLPDPAQEARAKALFGEIRCLVCQNESIDDSEADLAKDLRLVVRRQIAAGQSDAQVRAFLVDRYGQFVMLKPAFSWENAALWAAPPLVVVFGGLLLWGLVRRRPNSEGPVADELTAEEEARLAALLAETAGSNDTIAPQERLKNP